MIRLRACVRFLHIQLYAGEHWYIHFIFAILALYDEGQLCTMIRNTEPSPIHLTLFSSWHLMKHCVNQQGHILISILISMHLWVVLLSFSHTQPVVQLYIAPGRAQSALRLLTIHCKKMFGLPHQILFISVACLLNTWHIISFLLSLKWSCQVFPFCWIWIHLQNPYLSISISAEVWCFFNLILHICPIEDFLSGRAMVEIQDYSQKSN